jgi:hypothetical protein
MRGLGRSDHVINSDKVFGTRSAFDRERAMAAQKIGCSYSSADNNDLDFRTNGNDRKSPANMPG